MLKEIKDDTNGKIFHAYGLEEQLLLKFPYYPKQSTDLNTNNIFHRTRTNTPKICMEPQTTQNSQNNLGK